MTKSSTKNGAFLFDWHMQTSILLSDHNLLRQVEATGRLIGNTPLHHFAKLFSRKRVQLYGKMEWLQLGGSVKARPAYHIIRQAVWEGNLGEEKILLDATSGNTGIAYATIAARSGIKVALCLPENASKERKEILKELGAEIILTSQLEGTDGAQALAKEMERKEPDRYFYADQYKNNNNWKAHYNSTALEILKALPAITHFVAGLGTTGTFVGTGRRLMELSPSTRLVSLQPDSALHGLEGWKHLSTAVVPGIYDDTIAHENHEVSTEEAYEMIKLAHKFEGIRLSPSSAANLVGAIRVAEDLDEGIVVTVLPDNADKYSAVVDKIL
jgi:S-sulfo-L-cysteine synthase (O-acetyl-L-serine-dependent)